MDKNPVEKKYAIVKIAGRQYKVEKGQELVVNRIAGQPQINVLLFVDGEKIKIGKPYLKDVLVNTKILGNEKGEKLDVVKYKAKSRYRRKYGFRPQLTRLLITDLVSKTTSK